MTELVSCFVFILAFYGSPGPATLSLAASGRMNGVRNSLPYMSGIVSGIVVNLVLTFSGLTALMSAHSVFATVFRYAGFLYIIYLAWRIARSATDLNQARDMPFTYASGLLLNTLNPKAYLAAAVVFSQFESRLSLWTLTPMILVTTILADLGWIVAGSAIARMKPSAIVSRRINWTFAGALVVVAVGSFFF